MNETEQLAAKANAPEEQSDGIVVSFAAEWHDLLLATKFSAVIRKRVPKTVKSSWLYFHINSPICAIYARAEIQTIDELDLKQALSLAPRLALSKSAITTYFGGDKKIGYYKLGKITLAKRPLTKEFLCSQLAYHPPQSFFILSKVAKAIIDDLAGFGSNGKKG